ncbi:uncharacterized protein LOC128244548 [Mya arenaria]|uniref:uncharacterized protein LOC128244548 n=1 Tax=Mya arenaria TaxID=6604 RepID=UPI0022E6DBB0|nr:uncharacterized protein LOC128244548 [Mya arenaria]
MECAFQLVTVVLAAFIVTGRGKAEVAYPVVSCSGRLADSLTWRRTPEDCASAFICLLGRTVTYSCPEGFVIGAGNPVCVPVGSEWDDCKFYSSLDIKITPTCKPGSTAPDMSNCAKFAECIELPDGNASMVTRECPYPLLYKADSGKCESFKDASCEKDQIIPKSPCDYDANQCTSAHCIPCHVQHPTCTGLPDGMNAWVGREWSPFYVVCDEERVTLQAECKTEKQTSVFHPTEKQCVLMDGKDVFG